MLKSIEAQHGILTERAKGVYSFSHLTFQEYFTARRSIANSGNLKQLAIHVCEKRWREVFSLAIEMVQDADELLQLMKQEIDKLVASDKKIQDFLVWITHKTNSTISPYYPASIRACYISDNLEFTVPPFPFIVDSKQLTHVENARNLAQDFARNLEFERFCIGLFKMVADFDTVSRRPLRNRRLELSSEISSEENDYSNIIEAQELQESLLFPSGDNELDDDREMRRIHGENISILQSSLSMVVNRAESFNPKLSKSLSQLQSQLAGINSNEWFSSRGRNWRRFCKDVLAENRIVVHDWKFNVHQKEMLNQYYNANKLLLDCMMNVNCYITRPVREAIMRRFFLPIESN